MDTLNIIETLQRRFEQKQVKSLQCHCVYQNQSKQSIEKRFPAAVFLGITNEEHPRILLSRRANHLNSHAGEVSFPGGKRDKTDTTDISVALRETHEETGISPQLVTVLGELPVQKARSGLQVKPIVGLIPADVILIPEEAEVARLFWGDIQSLLTADIVPHCITYKGISINTPSYVVDGEIVWGLTGRILVSLLNDVFKKDIKWPYVLLK